MFRTDVRHRKFRLHHATLATRLRLHRSAEPCVDLALVVVAFSSWILAPCLSVLRYRVHLEAKMVTNQQRVRDASTAS